MEKFSVFIVTVITRIYTCVKIQRTVYQAKVNIKSKYVEDGLEGARQGNFNP